MPLALHIVGAPHSGVYELLEAVARELGADAVELHPLANARQGQSPAPTSTAISALTPHPAITLLTGLDWPCPAAELQGREQRDTELRRLLQDSGTPYRVVYGNADRRLANALAAARTAPSAAAAGHLSAAPGADGGGRENGEETGDHGPLKMRSWGCEKCSDPVCEHRLFTSLRLAATR